MTIFQLLHPLIVIEYFPLFGRSIVVVPPENVRSIELQVDFPANLNPICSSVQLLTLDVETVKFTFPGAIVSKNTRLSPVPLRVIGFGIGEDPKFVGHSSAGCLVVDIVV